jgi:quercetin dioxygenase-like cupin family protein
MTRRLVVVASLMLAAAACTTRRPSFYLPDGTSADALASKAPPPLRENVTVAELQRGENSSVSAVWVRDREQPHVHARYDLTVVVASGEGTLWLNGRPITMRVGDGVFIPKGTPHYFVNAGSAPAVAVVVFSPPFSGPDQQAVP